MTYAAPPTQTVMYATAPATEVAAAPVVISQAPTMTYAAAPAIESTPNTVTYAAAPVAMAASMTSAAPTVTYMAQGTSAAIPQPTIAQQGQQQGIAYTYLDYSNASLVAPQSQTMAV